MKTFIKMLVINLLILEVLSFVLIHFFYVEQPPNSYKQRFLPYFIDTEEPFTTWHYKNLSTRHIGPKWNVEYKFNSYGARDKERKLSSTNTRFLFLGDSFLEGYGIHQKDRLSDRLEESTGIECLNFAVSGIGQTQMNLIYENVGNKFSHDALFIGFYPFNDFRENDYANRKKYYANRYRPYRTKDSLGNFTLSYYQNSAVKSDYHASKFSEKGYFSLLLNAVKKDEGLLKKVKNIYFDFTYSGALIKSVIQRFDNIKEPHKKSILEKDTHHLENIKSQDWEILEHELRQIKNRAQNKPILLLFIPHPGDFAYRSNLARTTAVQEKAETLCNSLGIHYIDFLELLPQKELSKLYIKNDDHWSSYGNKMAEQIIKKKLLELNILQ